MNNHQEKLEELLARLALLSNRQALFQQEISALKQEIFAIKDSLGLKVQQAYEVPVKEQAVPVKVSSVVPTENSSPGVPSKPSAKKPSAPIIPVALKADFEKFIGENLINKIGIIITVLGVGIGAKYAIDNELISPLTRIILGYLMGFALLGFAIKLKAKYANFSAVLLSGAMAIMYFITYIAYDFYGLFPQAFAFALMVVFTVFTVIAAVHYNKQVIAHIGLVGAYAVPFLLSQGEGNVAVLFSYMVIINAGILIIAFLRYWKPLNYVAFGLTWLIYAVWYFGSYSIEDHFALAIIFLFLFFAVFYLTFLAYKFIKAERFEIGDIFLLLANSFIFYGIGYAILEDHTYGNELLGLYTLVNALLHFGVAVLIYKKKLADRNLFYLLAGLVLLFVTIAVPIQLDGNWVTLLWSGQALLLFWIGRKKNVPIYEALSYPLIVLSFISLIHDWDVYNRLNIENSQVAITPLLNIYFLTSLLFIIAFSGIHYSNTRFSGTSKLGITESIRPLLNYAIPGLLLFVSYFAFRLEIAAYWDQRYFASAIESAPDEAGYQYTQYNYSLMNFKTMWLLNYTLVFATLLIWGNIKKIRSNSLGVIALGLSLLAVAAFLTIGLYSLSELRTSYMTRELSQYYEQGIFHLLIRYVSLGCLAILLISVWKLLSQEFLKFAFPKAFDIFIHVCLVWVISSELINWMDLGGSQNSYKLGLSILWGVYALMLIAFGIWKKKKHLRLGAIALFAATLIKVFFYDISHLDTISKTIVFVSLGILLLVISFLYNKYKDLIANEKTI